MIHITLEQFRHTVDSARYTCVNSYQSVNWFVYEFADHSRLAVNLRTQELRTESPNYLARGYAFMVAQRSKTTMAKVNYTTLILLASIIGFDCAYMRPSKRYTDKVLFVARLYRRCEFVCLYLTHDECGKITSNEVFRGLPIYRSK